MARQKEFDSRVIVSVSHRDAAVYLPNGQRQLTSVIVLLDYDACSETTYN
jgi:hypothetical protein